MSVRWFAGAPQGSSIQGRMVTNPAEAVARLQKLSLKSCSFNNENLNRIDSDA
ncbi:MAG: hypothetical protein H7Z17_05505 [Fuerstia sp.]|nr:hypothetical protein [Fuerstiella sp.]